MIVHVYCLDVNSCMIAQYSSQLVMVVAACLLLLGVPVHRGTFAKTKPLSSKSY